jgi:hypothetical protein
MGILLVYDVTDERSFNSTYTSWGQFPGGHEFVARPRILCNETLSEKITD